MSAGTNLATVISEANMLLTNMRSCIERLQVEIRKLERIAGGTHTGDTR